MGCRIVKKYRNALILLLCLVPFGWAMRAAADPGAVASGVIALAVDLTDLDRRVYRVSQQIPVEPGPLTLLYPKWLPGNHAPVGPIEQLAGLSISGAGQRIGWRRDPTDMHAFHLQVPTGVSELDLTFQFASPLDTTQGRVVVTPQMLGLQWNTVLLYPAGRPAGAIRFVPRITLPADWQFATSLETAAIEGARIRFAPVTLETLVDSPLFAGRHARRFDLHGRGQSHVRLNAFADAPRFLDADPDVLDAHRRLVVQADRLFGARPFDRYDFLLALSSQFSGIGLEHLRSSENATYREYLSDPRRFSGRDLLAHEYVHAWNGKFRRPADLATSNFNEPMHGSLLWVYEGQTEYWGVVLAARSGLWSDQQAREAIADIAASYAHREGRVWRSLADTTNQPIIAYRRALAWPSWQRARDYYSEGQLVWLDVDTRLRELSRGRRSLDDFARAFFAAPTAPAAVSTYTFDDVVNALERLHAFDWRGFLRERIDDHGGVAPLDGLTRGGWKLVYRDAPSAYENELAARRGVADFRYSLGLRVATQSGRIEEVLWDSPAFSAGLAAGMTLVAVDGVEFDADTLRRAIAAATTGSGTLDLLVRNFDRYRTARIEYRGGLRHPHLERISGTPDRLGDILAPRR